MGARPLSDGSRTRFTERLPRRGRSGWMEVRFTVPERTGRRIMEFARTLGFRQMDEDWCTEKRDRDRATMDYAPVVEPPDRRVDW